MEYENFILGQVFCFDSWIGWGLEERQAIVIKFQMNK